MSNPRTLSSLSIVIPTLPKGDVLGTYETYDEALVVMDRLARADFPVQQMAIVGSDLRTVERVTGRMTYGKAALAGAASGMWFGLFLGILLFLFSPIQSQNTLLYLGAAILIGAAFGMLFGIVSYAINRRRRDFTSIHQVIAAKYEIMIDPSLTAKAKSVLLQPQSD